MEARRLDIPYRSTVVRRRRSRRTNEFARYRYWCLCRRGNALGRLQLATIVVTAVLMMCALTAHFLVIMPSFGHASWVGGPGGLALSLAIGLALAFIVLALARSAYATMATRTLLPHRKNGRRRTSGFRPVLHPGSAGQEGSVEPGTR